MDILPPTNESIETAKISSGQRRVNILWEATQASIAIAVTISFIFIAIKMIEAPDLKNAFFLIIGFYFGRTNHQKVGGIVRGTSGS